MAVFKPNRYPGKLIVVEGVDGAGKSTQLALLTQFLRARGLVVTSTPDLSPVAQSLLERGHAERSFTPTTHSLTYALDLAQRLESHIVPMLKAGVVVAMERYAYAAIARDVVRGVPRKWVRNLYRFAIQPNVRFCLKPSLDIALKRTLGRRDSLGYYQAGLDLSLTPNPEESFRLFQGRVLEEYDQMAEEMGFHIIDAGAPLEAQQKKMRTLVVRELRPHWKSLLSAAKSGESDAGEVAPGIL